MVDAQHELTVIFSDMTKFRQILFNLLSNACKFTENGSVTLTMFNAENESEDMISLSVTDTGIGMTDEQCAVIFDEFVQADSSTTKEYGGTGLGLAICQQFCELMGGHIAVSSTLGQGHDIYSDTAHQDSHARTSTRS